MMRRQSHTDAEMASYSNLPLNFPGSQFEFVPAAADLLLCPGQKDEEIFGGNIAGDHDRFIRNYEVLDQISRAGILRRPAGNPKQCAAFGRYRLDIETRIDLNIIQDSIGPGQDDSSSIGHIPQQPFQNAAEPSLYRVWQAFSALAQQASARRQGRAR